MSAAFAVFPILGGSGLLFGGGAALYADRRALEKDMRERESTQRRGHASGDHEEHLVLVRYRIHYIRIQSVNRSPPRFVCSESTLVRSGARIFFSFPLTTCLTIQGVFFSRTFGRVHRGTKSGFAL